MADSNDSLEVIIAKAMVDQINADRKDSQFIVKDFVADWEFSNRVELSQARVDITLPEEWLLKDDRLQVRVMIPPKPNEIVRGDRDSLHWTTHVDIDVRQKLGTKSQQADSTIDREALSKLGRFIDQLFLRTGPQLSEARLSSLEEIADSDLDGEAEWMDVNRTDANVGSEILFKYHPEWLRQRHFYGSIRQVFMVT